MISMKISRSGRARDLTPRFAEIQVEETAVHVRLAGLLPGVPHALQSRDVQTNAPWIPVDQWTPANFTQERVLSPPAAYRLFRASR